MTSWGDRVVPPATAAAAAGRLGRERHSVVANLVRRWAGEPPLEEILAWTTPWAYLVTIATLAVLLIVGAKFGGSQLGIALLPSLLALLPVVVSMLCDMLLAQRVPHAEIPLRLSNLFGTASYQFFALFMVATTRPVGQAVFGSLFLLLAAYQGFMNRASPRQVLAALATPVAAIAALLAAPDTGFVPVLALGLVGAVTAAVAGDLSLRLDRKRRQIEALRAAVQAQMDAEREQALASFRESLVASSGRMHDLVNHAQVAAICAAAIEEHLKPHGRGESRTSLEQLLRDLQEAVSATVDLVKSARLDIRASRERLVGLDRAFPAQALAAALKTVGRRFPHIDFGCASIDPGISVAVVNGEGTLVRILENLLTNACEGDGTRGAQRVTVSARLEAGGTVANIAVEDDGPGFSSEMLRRGIVGLSTTKAHGTGLGLYTVERLVRASGGEIRLANRPRGGARVEVLLPTPPDAVRA